MDVPNETIAYALAAGDTVVWKPSEITPLSADLFTQVIARRASHPEC